MKKHGRNSLKSYIDRYCPRDKFVERWIYIDGEKSIYKIRDNGDVVSTEYQGHKRKKDHIMVGGIDKNGYRLVTLTHNHTKKTYKVHRLVAEYFIPNPFWKPEVNHKDGDTINNDVSNLEWVYGWENIHHAMDIGLRYATNSVEYIHLVCQLLESNDYSIREISEISGVSDSMISKIRNHVCYKWISDEYNIDKYNPDDHIVVPTFEKLSDSVVESICDEIVKNELTVSQISRKFQYLSQQFCEY